VARRWVSDFPHAQPVLPAKRRAAAMFGGRRGGCIHDSAMSRPTLPWLAPLFVCGLVVLGGACSYTVVSPPARFVNLESAQTAAPGETVGGVHGGALAGVFDPALVTGSAGVRRGVAEGVEVDADATWGHLKYDNYPDIDRNIYAVRAGAKVRGAPRFIAAFGGVGGGYSPAGGGFVAADLGAVLSLPNCYVVPSLIGSGIASVPIGAKRIDFVSGDGTLVASDKAITSYGYALGVALEVPLSRARCRDGLTPPRIQLGLGGTRMIRSDAPRSMTTAGDETTNRDGYGVIGLTAGFEMPF
jgi:hypothetical protein